MLASTDADSYGGCSGNMGQLDVRHLLGVVQMDGNLLAQKAAAEQIAQVVSKNHGVTRGHQSLAAL